MTRIALIISFLLFACATCFSQSSYKGLTPGQSTRADVERVLGQPVGKVSETLIEYRPQPLTKKVYVQYRKDSQLVERIEVLCKLEKSGCSDFLSQLNLTMTDDDWEATSGRDFQTEKKYYRAPYYVVLTGSLDNWQRTAFYSRELYEASISGPDVKSVFDRCAMCQNRKQEPPVANNAMTNTSRIPSVIKVCQTFPSQQQTCGTWTLNVDHFDVRWENEKETMTIKIQQFDNDRVSLGQTNSTPQGDVTVTYTGHINGNKIEGGTVNWTWTGGSRSGTWTASW